MTLLEATRTSASPATFLSNIAHVFATFDERTQDSGNVSYGVQTELGRFFVKTAGSPSAKAFLPHAERVHWLRNAVRLSQACQDPALCRLLNVIEAAEGPMLVYEWISGELIGTPAARRQDPTSPFTRFKRLRLPELSAALTTVFRCHARLCSLGWIANDFYDGAMMYDFEARRLRLVDLDLYRQGPFVNEMGRMFGSTRFMAPEEQELGARIDESTTVFTMGRCISVFLAERDEQDAKVQVLLDVARSACHEDRARRLPSMQQFLERWLQASASLR